MQAHKMTIVAKTILRDVNNTCPETLPV